MSQPPDEDSPTECDPATAPEPSTECDPAKRQWYASCDDLSVFTQRQFVPGGTDRLTIVEADKLPTALNGPALRAEVKDNDKAYNEGDTTKGGTGNDWRAEVLGLHMNQSEDVICYTWHTLFPKEFPEHPRKSDDQVGKPATSSNHPWQVFFQWHQGDANLPLTAGDVGNSPPLAFIIENDTMVLDLEEPDYEGELDPVTGDPNKSKVKGRWKIGPLERGRWHSFRVEVRWHLTDGLLRVWHDGRALCFHPQSPPNAAGAEVFPERATWELTGIGTLFPARKVKLSDGLVGSGPNQPEAYLKAGFYRQAAPAWVASTDSAHPGPVRAESFVVYHDEIGQCVLKQP